jgi:putative CocE/NonD family hydrolase
MRTVTDFPRKVKEIENLWIPLSDGARLAARMWLPEDAEAKPVPAILEYLPYRKRDGTIVRDALTHPYLAGHGYACLRVDMRGSGDSDGVMLDEYAKQEQDDAVEVIAWIAAQAWCTAKVGMMGISWGGFNSLQVAARKPEALKAIVTLCSTDDRYADDVHYRGGAVISEMLGWGGTMFAYSARPPDPLIVGRDWRNMWRERLENEPLLAIEWLKHPTRDDYWKHGSVNENIGDIEAACLIVGGWNDAYSNAVPRLMASLRSPCKAIIGPWAHKYPHFAVPEPRIGFLQEMLRWWDFWLKGETTGVMRDAPFRYFIIEAEPPGTDKTRLNGRWVEDQLWGAGNSETKTWYLNANGIGGAVETEQALTVSSPQDTGMMGGEWCVIWLGPEYPGDQRDDDAKSLCFDTPELRVAMDIVGAPSVELELSVDKPVASLAARLCDVWPDGQVSRITYGLLNLTHRDSHELPEPLEPGKRYRIKLRLDDIAWRIPAGHKLRVALSTSYWPIMWPAPEAATVTVYSGASRLHLPVRRDIPGEMRLGWPPAEAAAPAELKVIEKPWHKREFTTDAKTGVRRLEIIDDFGRHEIAPHGLITWAVGRETHSIHPDDPLFCMMKTHWTEELQRGRWQVRIEAITEMRASKTHWLITGRLEAYEGRKLVFARDWHEKIARHLN